MTTSLTLNTIPARQAQEIYQGSPWPGVRFRALDADSESVDITVTAQVRTTTVDQSGRLLADCTVSSPDADGWIQVSLDGDTTLTFPERQVFIDVDAVWVEGDTPTPVIKIVADVIGEITAAPIEGP